jgi:hypothetical protein
VTDYPDIETVLLDWLEATYTGLATSDAVRRVDTETPPNLQELLLTGGFARVGLVTGRDDAGGWNHGGTTDYSVVDVDYFANSRDAAYAGATDIRSRLTGSPHRVGEVVIDRVSTEEKPRRLPWADENTWRFGATYRISARR